MNTALLLAGGTGRRLGSEIPKQYLCVQSKMLITWTIQALCDSEKIDAFQIVAAEAWRPAIQNELPLTCNLKGFSPPGDTRQQSILNGLDDISVYASSDDTILIHDAARPFISSNLINSCYETLPGHDGVLPVLPMTDTIYFSESGKSVERLLQRDALFAGQSPELFRFGPYMEASKMLTPEQIAKIRGTCEPAVLAGLDIAMIPGSRKNFKITTWEDIVKCQELLSEAGR